MLAVELSCCQRVQRGRLLLGLCTDVERLLRPQPLLDHGLRSLDFRIRVRGLGPRQVRAGSVLVVVQEEHVLIVGVYWRSYC